MRQCPKCWASDYTPWFTTSTLVYYPPRIVNWVNVNPDRNSCKEERRCNVCWTMVEVETNENRIS